MDVRYCLFKNIQLYHANSTQGVGTMEDKEKKESEEKAKKKQGESLPFCTNAPSPEHSRGDSEDAPCDDSRSGK